MGQIKETMKQYKWVLLAGMITAVLIALITANFHVLQFMKYKMNNNTEGIVSTLQSTVTNSRSQNEWYFKQGMEYLVGQQEYTEEVRTFFETNFNYFTEERKKQIIKGYNSKKLSFTLTKELMTFLVECREDANVKAYLQRMTPEELENGLILVYGNTPKADKAFITSLNEVLSVYPQKLPFKKFKFSLYEVLASAGDNITPEVKSIFSKIDAQSARENIFKEMALKELSEKQLVNWIKFFKDSGLISLNEYASFDSLYSDIGVLRTQYAGLDDEKIQLQNKKDSVEAQISDSNARLEEKQKEIVSQQNEVAAVENKLESLTNYAYMSLYIEHGAGTGSDEYIASIPRGGLFGFKPSSQKYIVKLTSSNFLKEGVYNLNVFLEGTKTTGDGGQYAYYVEVSNSDIASIDSLTADRNSKLEKLNALKQEAADLESSINRIKEENKYDEVVEALNSIDSRRSEYMNKVTEKVVSIKELFGLSDLKMTIDNSTAK